MRPDGGGTIVAGRKISLFLCAILLLALPTSNNSFLFLWTAITTPNYCRYDCYGRLHHLEKRKSSFLRIFSTNSKSNGGERGEIIKEEEKETRSSSSSSSSSGRLLSFRSKQQERRKHSSTTRKPKYYWTDQLNLQKELQDFWYNLGVDLDGVVASSSSQTPQRRRRRRLCIPNEALLNYFNRHDLRAAIASNGGRQELAIRLLQLQQQQRSSTASKNAVVIDVMPGKWKEAVATSPELQILLRNSTLGLMRDVPPSSSSSSGSKGMLIRSTKSSTSSSSCSTKSTINSSIDGSGRDTRTTNTDTTKTVNGVRTSNLIRRKRWSHNKTQRKPRGYWTDQEILMIELYDYLDWYHENYGRPSIWMPRPQELVHNGREDLKCAMNRFFPSSSSLTTPPSSATINNEGIRRRRRNICQIAGLVPYREWHFFEGQYELLVLLKEYMDKYHDDDTDNQYDNDTNNISNDDEEEESLRQQKRRYEVFPCVSDVKDRGYHRLYLLIQYYGGRKFLASRLGMSSRSSRRDNDIDKDEKSTMNWGNFSLEFAIRLCQFIRRDHQRAKPPIRNPVICIPTQRRLFHAGKTGKDDEGIWLHNRIMEFGGYENVARRLYLGYRFK